MFFALALLAPSAHACPGSETASNEAHPTMASAAVDPTHCAKDGALVGGCCSYSTNLMAQRIHADGADTTVTATLVKTDEMLASKVAAPWKAGEYRVIANAVMENVDTAGTLSLTGKALEVDGVKYFLVTGATPSAT